MDKPVDNYVENLVDNAQNPIQKPDVVDINTFIIDISATFPLFFAEKRYKLIKFAPK